MNGKFRRRRYTGTGIVCRVCGDKSSGLNYGVLTCGGCKAFFRRSILQKKQYRVCKKPYGCFVLKTNRNQCQYCRFRRCIEVGMSYNVKGVREIVDSIPNMVSNVTEISKGEQTDFGIQLQAKYIAYTVQEAFRKASSSLENCAAVYTLQKIGIENNTYINRLYFRHISTVVRFITTFATEIPFFNYFDKHVRIHLVKDVLIEMATLIDQLQMKLYCNCIFHSELKIFISNDKFNVIGLLANVMRCMNDVSLKLEELNFTSIEIALMSAIVLFCPDREGISKNATLVKLNADLVWALKIQISSRQGNENTVFAGAMEILTELRTISAMYLKDILNTKL